MQQRPENQQLEQLRSQRNQRTQPALPGASSSTAVLPSQYATSSVSVQATKRGWMVFGAVSQLTLLGVLLELLYLALYPLLAFAGSASSSQQALGTWFPWLSPLSWTSLVSLLGGVSWLNPAGGDLGRTNCWLLLLTLAALFSLLAAYVGGRVQRIRLSAGNKGVLLWWILLFAALFSLTMVFTPLTNTVFTHDLLLSGLYGRMVAIYHSNPYVVSPAVLAQDGFQRMVNAHSVSPYGPVWIDLSMLAVLFSQNNLADTVLMFRLLALATHLLNAILVWAILSRLKPEIRFSGVLLYAWNPLVLLLGVAQVHQELALLFFLLLATFFILHRLALPGWICVLLAALMNPLYLLVLPLFLPLLIRYIRTLTIERRLFWWTIFLLLSTLIVLLAYLPYWSGWGARGIVQNILQVFWPSSAQNSLAAAVLHLPLHLPDAVIWLFYPHHWAAVTLLVLGCFLLFGLWLVDTLEMALLFTCWLLLLAILLLPVYWPWYVLVPLALALVSTNRQTSILATLLMLGGLLCYYCWQWQSVWLGLALLCLGAPVVLWGWSLFFASTWQLVQGQEEVDEPRSRLRRFSRPPRFSRP